jgi:SAM-dependent methyltransferase
MSRVECERAKLFDREAQRYDQIRPGYPDDLINDVLGPHPQALSVLDVACGTGIASRLMMERGPQVVGVELNPRMAEVARRSGVPTEVGRFETWDPAGRTFDRVTSAQGWHWLDPVVSSRKAAAVLRPAGRLCVFWSVGHHPDELADALHAAYQRVLPPAFPALVIGYAANNATDPKPELTPVVDELLACQQFAEPQTKWFPWHRRYTRDQWLDQLRTHSDHIALGSEVRQRLFDEIAAVIDRFGGTFEMTYATVLISATRR